MSSFRIQTLPLVFYLFLLGLAFFLSTTLGGHFTGLLALLFLFLSLDLLQVFLTAHQVYLSEHFSTDHLVKGQSADYRLSLEAGLLPLRSSRMDMELRFSSPLLAEDSERITLWLGSGTQLQKKKEITCRFRGAYELGLTSLEIRSWTGWFLWTRDLWPRTFYVLPRIIPLGNSVPFSRQWGAGFPSLLAPQSPPALFDHVVPYREGIPLKYLDWKPLARNLPPVVRNFLPETWSLVNFFLDLGCRETTEESMEETLITQDLCIETAASLIHGLVISDLPACCWTCRGSSGILSGLPAFQTWLESTVSWEFQSLPSLGEVWKSSGLKDQSQGAVFISHRPDPHLWEILLRMEGERSLICVVKGWTGPQRQVWEEWQGILMRSGCRSAAITDLEDLRRAFHG